MWIVELSTKVLAVRRAWAITTLTAGGRVTLIANMRVAAVGSVATALAWAAHLVGAQTWHVILDTGDLVHRLLHCSSAL